MIFEYDMFIFQQCFFLLNRPEELSYNSVNMHDLSFVNMLL